MGPLPAIHGMQHVAVSMVPAALGANLWLDARSGVTADGAGGVARWSCRLGNGDATPFQSPFALSGNTVSSAGGQGMLLPPTPARTLFFSMTHRGFPDGGTISSLISDSVSGASDNYVFLNGTGSYEASIDGRIGRIGRYRRNGVPEVTGGNVGTASPPVGARMAVLVRYSDAATAWRLLGAFIGSDGVNRFGSDAIWHQVCTFERELADAEADMLERWALDSVPA